VPSSAACRKRRTNLETPSRPGAITDELRDVLDDRGHWYGFLVTDEDEASHLIPRMNAELRGDTSLQEVRQLVSRLWDAYNEARDQGGHETGTGVDSGTQERIRRLDLIAATTMISRGIPRDGIRVVESVEEARRLLEEGDGSEVIAVALKLTADPATADALDEASAKLSKAGAANLNPTILVMIVFVLITLALSIGQAELPGNVQTMTTDWAANLALALAISDHIKRNKSS
jgi:hypothetical protein